MQFEIWTDYHNLQYFMEAKKLNQWQACWALYLSRFDFNLVHKSGPTIGKADALSRCTDYKEGIEHDNENVVLLKPVRATPKPASSMAHSTVTRALALWAHT